MVWAPAGQWALSFFLSSDMKYLVSIVAVTFFASCQQENARYVCKPCNRPCDTLVFHQAGRCPHCNMELIPEPNLVLNEVTIEPGKGAFKITDSRDSAHHITVHYYSPQRLTEQTSVLMVIPGSGRDGDEYRNAWTDAAEQYNLLVLSPVFNADDYPFNDYHLGGLVRNANLLSLAEPVKGTNRVFLDEDRLVISYQTRMEKWLFAELDRIFIRATTATGTGQATYDLFGHSAGGHILHRMALFHQSPHVNRMLASNASFYTLPDTSLAFPFGLKDSPFKIINLQTAFQRKLTVFLGEEDDAEETGGIFLVSASADEQGAHRLERGKYFYQAAREKAGAAGLPFNWQLEVVPGVGHDFRLMSRAAAEYLYGEEKNTISVN